MKHSITSVGLDTHKDSIEIALAEHGGSQEVRRRDRDTIFHLTLSTISVGK
jgi:hypothetical protein